MAFNFLKKIQDLFTEDEEERKRRQKFQESVSKLFNKGVETTSKTVSEFSKKAFQQSILSKQGLEKAKTTSPLSPWAKPYTAMSSEEKKKQREEFISMGIGMAGTAPTTGSKLLAKAAKKLKISPEAITEKVREGASPVFKSLRKQFEKQKVVQPQFDEAAEYIASKVGRKPTGVTTGVTTKARDLLDILKSRLVESFSPIEDTITRIEKKAKFKLAPTEDPRLLRSRVLGTTDIAKQMFKSSGLEKTLKVVGTKDLKEFNHYLAARQVLDVAGRGIKTGVDLEKARIFVDTLSSKYEPAAQQVTNFTRRFLTYVRESGLISKETEDLLNARYPNYVPINRVFDEITQSGLSKKAVASLSKQTVVQKLIGSERDIRDPLESIVEKTVEGVRQVEVNRTAQAVINLRHIPEFADVIKPTTISGKNTISVFENGIKKLYEVPPEFAEAAKNLNQESLNFFMRLASVPTRTVRFGYTGANIPFAFTNIVRDQLTAFITSEHVFRTSLLNPFNFGRALFDVIRQGGVYDDFLASGGGWSTFFQTGRQEAKLTVQGMAKSNKAKILNTVTNPTKWLGLVENFLSMSEQTTRTQQFLGYKQALGGKGKVNPFALPTEENLLAMIAGRENTVDFGKGGAYKNVLNAGWVYFSANIQGARLVINTLKKHPVGSVLKLTTTLFAPIAATTLWNVATPERHAAYKDITDWERKNNLIILPPTPVKDKDGNYPGAIKIPLPQGFRGLTYPVRAAIENLAQVNPQSIPQALAEMLSEISPVPFTTLNEFTSRVTPTSILPPIESVTNTNLFSGTRIVPRSKENLPPELQTAFDTSAFATEIGKVLKFSPAKIQNFIQGYSGGVGLQILNAIDTGMAKAGLIDQDKVGGRGLVEDIQNRFTKLRGGREEELAFEATKPFKEQAAIRSLNESAAAENIYADLQELPRDKWRSKLRELKKEGILNERIYNRIKVLDEAEQSGLKGSDKAVKSLQTVERAQYIYQELSKIDRSKQRAYLQDLKKKKILTKAVYETLLELGYTVPR